MKSIKNIFFICVSFFIGMNIAAADSWVKVATGASFGNQHAYVLASQLPNLTQGQNYLQGVTRVNNWSETVYSLKHITCGTDWTYYLEDMDLTTGAGPFYTLDSKILVKAVTPGAKLQFQWQDRNTGAWTGFSTPHYANNSGVAQGALVTNRQTGWVVYRWRVVPTTTAPSVCASGKAFLTTHTNNL